MSNKIDKVFVFGTLMSNQYHNTVILGDKEEVTLLGEDLIDGKFTMIRFGYNPAVILHEDGTTPIKGEVYQISKDILKRIDSLEGFDYTLKDIRLCDRIVVKTSYGPAYMYVMPENYLDEEVPIVYSGNWKKESEKLLISQ